MSPRLKIPDLQIETKTRTGINLLIREMKISDVIPLYRCIKGPLFSYPYLTGTSDPIRKKPNYFLRSCNYVIVLALISRMLGVCLFGARRHWLMTIEESKTGVFLGVVLIDALVRLSRDATDSSVSQFVEKHKEKPDAKVGDGELGFFLCPEHWRRGIAMQAIYALMSSLAVTESWCQPDGPILRRVWAETSDNNVAARGLLEKMGLVMRPEYNISGELSPRFHRNGQRVNLVHYAQSDGDQISGSPLAIEQLLRRLEEHQLVRPGWKFRRHKFIG